MEHRSGNRRLWIHATLLSVFIAAIFFVTDVAVAAQTKGLQVVIKDRQGKQVGLYSESHALVIGVAKYTNGWPQLEGVPHEIERVERALLNQGFDVSESHGPRLGQAF